MTLTLYVHSPHVEFFYDLTVGDRHLFGVAVAQEIEQSGLSLGGLIPGPCSLHVEVSLGEILSPKLLSECTCDVCLPDEQVVPCMIARSISMCVWMIEQCLCCKVLWAITKTRKHYINAVHSPFIHPETHFLCQWCLVCIVDIIYTSFSCIVKHVLGVILHTFPQISVWHSLYRNFGNFRMLTSTIKSHPALVSDSSDQLSLFVCRSWHEAEVYHRAIAGKEWIPAGRKHNNATASLYDSVLLMLSFSCWSNVCMCVYMCL